MKKKILKIKLPKNWGKMKGEGDTNQKTNALIYSLIIRIEKLERVIATHFDD